MGRTGGWKTVSVCATAILTLLCPASPLVLARTTRPTRAPERITWSDGIATYDSEPPVAGYLVPQRVMTTSGVPLEKVIGAARRLSKSELSAYHRGGTISPTTDFPLLVYRNRGMNLLLWKGRPDGQQQVIPTFWDGYEWRGKGYGQFRANAIEFPFYLSPQHKKVYVLIRHQNGQLDRNSLRTEQVFFSPQLPAVQLFNRAMKSGKTVVYLPPWPWNSRPAALDVLSGSTTVEELQAAGVSLEKASGQFFCLDGKGVKRRVLWSWRGGAFTGDYGELNNYTYRRNVTLEQMVAEDPSLKPYLELNSFRWRLARDAAGPGHRDSPCRLRLSEPTADGWSTVELTVGKDSPGDLYAIPYDRAGKGGGSPRFTFLIKRDNKSTPLWPEGRFGERSLKAALPHHHEHLGLEYRFISGGEGVMKLVFRPLQRPWQGEISAEFLEVQRFRDESPKPHHSGRPLSIRY